MTHHIAIRKRQFGHHTRYASRIEILTQTHSRINPTPWGRIAVGDAIWVKWSGGPIVVKAFVREFVQVEDCTPVMLRDLVKNTRLSLEDSYFQQLPPLFNAVVIYLHKEEILHKPVEPKERSFGSSWIVLEDPNDIKRWLPGVLRD